MCFPLYFQVGKAWRNGLHKDKNQYRSSRKKLYLNFKELGSANFDNLSFLTYVFLVFLEESKNVNQNNAITVGSTGIKPKLSQKYPLKPNTPTGK